jgi:hypothetical protein
MNRTYRRLRQYIKWEGMSSDVENFIMRSEKYQKNKLTHDLTLQTHYLQYLKCSVGIFGSLSHREASNWYILIVQDDRNF